MSFLKTNGFIFLKIHISMGTFKWTIFKLFVPKPKFGLRLVGKVLCSKIFTGKDDSDSKGKYRPSRDDKGLWLGYLKISIL